MNTKTSTFDHVGAKVTTAAISVIIAVALTLGFMPTTAEARSFKDVSESHWAYESIEQAKTLGYMTGDGNGKTFRPNYNLTRAESVTALYKVAGMPSTKGMKKVPFKDVKSKDWFNKSVTWGYNKKISTGYSKKTFGPYDYVTREQFATLLYRQAQIEGESTKLTAAGKKKFNKMPDRKQVSSYAKNAVIWAMQEGIITGVGGKYIAPQAHTTRAEVATMLVRAKHTHSYDTQITKKIWTHIRSLHVCGTCETAFNDPEELNTHQKSLTHGSSRVEPIYGSKTIPAGYKCVCGAVKK